MNLNYWKKRLRDFASERDWEKFHTPKNLAVSISIEANELLEIFQWLPNGRSANQGDIENELADIMIYIIRLADILEIDIEKAIQDKIIINERKYPVDKSKGNAIKYNKRK